MNGGPRNAKGFTIREQLLIADYLKTRGANATESAKRAGYSGNRNTLGVTAFETLRRPKIAREINRRMNAKLSTDEVESEIAEVALADVPLDAPAKMKALDLLTKIKGMVTTKIEQTSTVTTIDPVSINRSIDKIASKTNQPKSIIAQEFLEEWSKTDDPDYDPALHQAIQEIVNSLPVEQIAEQISESSLEQ